MQKCSEDGLGTVEKQMRDLPGHMRSFSVSLRSLYAENKVSTGTPEEKKFRQLRDDTRRDAMVYVNGILPVSTAVVRYIDEFFEYYLELTYDEWKCYLEDIIKEVQGYKNACTEVVSLHEDIMIKLKVREDEAKELEAMYALKNAAMKEEIKNLEEEKEEKKKVWFWLAFVPLVNLISTPILKAEIEENLADAQAVSTNLDINHRAVCVIKNVMRPALKSFLDGLSAVAGFFSAVENELTIFQSKAEKSMDNPKELHYKMMKKRAKAMMDNCTSFYAVIPDVRTDFEAIQFSKTDSNYVDQWLEEKRNAIKIKYQGKITAEIKKMVSTMSKSLSYSGTVTQEITRTETIKTVTELKQC